MKSLHLSRTLFTIRVSKVFSACVLACTTVFADSQIVPFVSGASGGVKATQLRGMIAAAKEDYAAAVREIGGANAEIDALNNTAVRITYIKKDASGKLTVLANTGEVSNGYYAIFFEWVRYREFITSEGRTLQYGIGGRASGSIYVAKGSLLLSIASLLVGVNKQNVMGQLDARLCGISGAPIDGILSPTQMDVTDKTIEAYLIQFATINSKVREAGVHVSPVLLSVDMTTAVDLNILTNTLEEVKNRNKAGGS